MTPDERASSRFAPYLAHSDIIDWQQPEVKSKAAALAAGSSDPTVIAARCYVWVRDEIRHSADFRLNPVTCRASEVLAAGTGFCYAKSHLLAALLRANRIPAGLCYQRLRQDDAGTRFCLHGLNAVYLPDVGWYRADPRGNKDGIDARFTPPVEQLAFHPQGHQEVDFDEIWPAPIPQVVDVLTACRSFQEVLERLPDVLPSKG